MKLFCMAENRGLLVVTPRAGVWIETASVRQVRVTAVVTPRAGVWIETLFGKRFWGAHKSPPVRGCGLKQGG